MKSLAVTSMIILNYFAIQAQRYSHGIGGQYASYSGAFGNWEMLSVMYTPRMVYDARKTSLALVAPITIGKYVSSARSSSPIMVEIPVAVEYGFTLNRLPESRREYSLFIGAGGSGMNNSRFDRRYTYYTNYYAGARWMIGGQPLEFRFNYGRSVTPVSWARLHKVGFGILYIVR